MCSDSSLQGDKRIQTLPAKSPSQHNSVSGHPRCSGHAFRLIPYHSLVMCYTLELGFNFTLWDFLINVYKIEIEIIHTSTLTRIKHVLLLAWTEEMNEWFYTWYAPVCSQINRAKPSPLPMRMHVYYSCVCCLWIFELWNLNCIVLFIHWNINITFSVGDALADITHWHFQLPVLCKTWSLQLNDITFLFISNSHS